jgi:hypothetical protein
VRSRLLLSCFESRVTVLFIPSTLISSIWLIKVKREIILLYYARFSAKTSMIANGHGHVPACEYTH